MSAAPATAGGRPVTFASLDGVVLSGQIYEAGTRPAPGVVLVHMLSRSRADWDGPAMVLQALGVTALAVDLRGHGGSSGAADLPDMVQDVRAAGIGGIGVEHIVSIAKKAADAVRLAFVVLVPVVVLGRARLFVERHAEIPVEAGPFRGVARHGPTHALPERGEPGPGRA